MIIQKRRVLSLTANLPHVEKGTSVVLGMRDLEQHREKLLKMGFGRELKVGEQILPTPVFGPISRFNALGKNIIHRDKPMETAYRMANWSWVEWHGRDRVERSKIVDIPYQRYPRTKVPPPSLEFRIVQTMTNEKILVTRPIPYIERNEELLRHGINLFLEIFRECHLFTEEMESIVDVPVRRVNWEILPPGEWPWERLQPKVEPIIRRARKGNQQMILSRLKTISNHKPAFVAVGRGGFHGYLIFGFPRKGLYVLESLYIDNATYILDRDWETLSQLTKSEILNEGLHKDRFIHRAGWHQQVHKLLS